MPIKVQILEDVFVRVSGKYYYKGQIVSLTKKELKAVSLINGCEIIDGEEEPINNEELK